MSKFGSWNPYENYEQSRGRTGYDGGKGSGKGGKGVGRRQGGGNWNGSDGKGKGGCHCAISFGIFEQSCVNCSGGGVRLKDVSQATMDGTDDDKSDSLSGAALTKAKKALSKLLKWACRWNKI